MSSSLSWFLKPKTHSLPDELKHLLAKRYDLHTEREFSHDDRTYLMALDDAGIKGARELIDLIDKYDSVFLKLEY